MVQSVGRAGGAAQRGVGSAVDRHSKQRQEQIRQKQLRQVQYQAYQHNAITVFDAISMLSRLPHPTWAVGLVSSLVTALLLLRLNANPCARTIPALAFPSLLHTTPIAKAISLIHPACTIIIIINKNLQAFRSAPAPRPVWRLPLSRHALCPALRTHRRPRHASHRQAPGATFSDVHHHPASSSLDGCCRADTTKPEKTASPPRRPSTRVHRSCTWEQPFIRSRG
jgi:hypothetical protein